MQLNRTETTPSEVFTTGRLSTRALRDMTEQRENSNRGATSPHGTRKARSTGEM